MSGRPRQPASALIALLTTFVRLFPRNTESKLAWVLLGVVNVIVWTLIGTLGGFVLAFFTFYLEPQGPTQGRVAIAVFLVSVFACIVAGFVIAIKGYRRKTAAMGVR